MLKYLLLFHGNNGYVNAPHCYISAYITSLLIFFMKYRNNVANPLNAELNPICHLLALLGAHHILHVSRVRAYISR